MDVNKELKFCENSKKMGLAVGAGSGWGVRVDVNEELKSLGKFKKKIGGSGGRGEEGSGWGGGQGGCDRRIEVFGKIHKKRNSGGVGFGVFGLGGGGGSGWM